MQLQSAGPLESRIKCFGEKKSQSSYASYISCVLWQIPTAIQRKACRCHAGRQEMFIAAMMLYAAANACIGATPAAYAADVMPQSVSGFGLGIYRCAGDIGMVHLLLMHIVVSCNLSSNYFCNILRTGHMAFCLCRMLHKTASKCNGGRIHPSCSISETAPPLV